MRVEKDGYVLHLEGTWMEISNKYGVLGHGDVATNPEDRKSTRLNSSH